MSDFVYGKDATTQFAITGLPLIPEASRGIKCKYTLIDNGQVHMSVNGVAISTARPQFNLFEITWSCEDNWPPGLATVWKGAQFELYGDDTFLQLASLPQVRPAVGGVVTYLDAYRNVLPDSTGAVFMRYAPRFALTIVVDRTQDEDEWGDVVGWSLKFRESQ